MTFKNFRKFSWTIC